MADGVARRPREVAMILGLTPAAASAAMRRMVQSGVLQSRGAGVYRLGDVEPPLSVAPLTAGDDARLHDPKPPPAPIRLPPLDPPCEIRSPTVADQDGSLRGDVARAAFVAKLWLKDAARFRFNDYHWEKRRRRLQDRDRKTGRATT
jgi:hypothetical protein